MGNINLKGSKDCKVTNTIVSGKIITEGSENLELENNIELNLDMDDHDRMVREAAESDFDRAGDLITYNELYKYLYDGGILVGEAAAAFLAEEHAAQTHGNYAAETLWRRSDLNSQYVITVTKRKTPNKPD